MPSDFPIIRALERYSHANRQRWHTPGHKGTAPSQGHFLDWGYDITEVGEFSDPIEGPVSASQQAMAETYGALRTWYSVQGATLPVMAAILAANPWGRRIWVDRNAHQAVLHAFILGDYIPQWIYPPLLKAGLLLPIDDRPMPADKPGGLVLTRPTYDGIAGPVDQWIDSAHQAGYTVVIDEAHGSHWTGDVFPRSAGLLGADLVAQGSHKSEATLTQTGLLHRYSDRIDDDAVDRAWALLATTSPSYLLLAALDRLQGERHQPAYFERWHSFGRTMFAVWDRLAEKGFLVLQKWARDHGYQVDPARLTLIGPGPIWARDLERVGVVEKVTPRSITFFLTPATPLEPLVEAIRQLPPADHPERELTAIPYPRLESALSPREAWNARHRWVPADEAVGRILSGPLIPYPPGIPLGWPGEVVSPDILEWLTDWREATGAAIQGIKQQGGRPWVRVVEA